MVELTMIVDALKWGFRKVGLDVHKLYQPPENRFKWLQEFDIKTIIDVGANRGQFAFMIQPFFPEATIYCFEPQRDVAANLAKKAARKGLSKKLFVFDMALGSAIGTVKINRAGNTTDSSLLAMSGYFKEIYKRYREPKQEDVFIGRLDDFNINIRTGLMVKIDVEGHEKNVILGAEKTLEKAKIVYIEVTFHRERYLGQVMFGELYDMLRDRGFDCAGFGQTYFHYHTGAPYYADAVFLKN